MTRIEKAKRAAGRRPSSDPVADFKHRLRVGLIGCATLVALYGLGFWLTA